MRSATGGHVLCADAQLTHADTDAPGRVNRDRGSADSCLVSCDLLGLGLQEKLAHPQKGTGPVHSEDLGVSGG